MKRALLTVAVLAAGPAAAAGDRYAAPAGCEVFATVQVRGCEVHQLYRCAGDPPGHQWTASIDGGGEYHRSQIDAETRWTASVNLQTGETRTLGPEAADPASFTALLQTGRDDFDFTTVSSRGEVLRYVGFDVLTGESVTIDGVALERTRFESTAYYPDGSLAWRSEGGQYIHREWRQFFAGTEEFENWAGDRESLDGPPVEFAFPGDEGFLSTEPQYDCDVLAAGLVLP